MSKKIHKDVEFHVDLPNGETFITHVFDEAAGRAVAIAASGYPTKLDVVIWSESGARKFGGSNAVEQYREDPDASVFQRLKISVNDEGRIA